MRKEDERRGGGVGRSVPVLLVLGLTRTTQGALPALGPSTKSRVGPRGRKSRSLKKVRNTCVYVILSPSPRTPSWNSRVPHPGSDLHTPTLPARMRGRTSLVEEDPWWGPCVPSLRRTRGIGRRSGVDRNRRPYSAPLGLLHSERTEAQKGVRER